MQNLHADEPFVPAERAACKGRSCQGAKQVHTIHRSNLPKSSHILWPRRYCHSPCKIAWLSVIAHIQLEVLDELHNREAWHRGVCAEDVQSQLAILCARTPNVLCTVRCAPTLSTYLHTSGSNPSFVHIFGWSVCGQVCKQASGQVGKWLVHGSHHFAQSQFAILSPRTPHSSRPCTLSLPSPLSNPFVTTFPAGHCRLCSAECRHSWVVDAFKHILKICDCFFFCFWELMLSWKHTIQHCVLVSVAQFDLQRTRWVAANVLRSCRTLGLSSATESLQRACSAGLATCCARELLILQQHREVFERITRDRERQWVDACFCLIMFSLM